MPNGVPNTGSFAGNLGDVSALKQAMARRGMDASILDQVSASAPTGATAVAPALPEGAGIGIPQQQAPSQVPSTQTPDAPPFRSSEMSLALKALDSVVKTENSIIKSALSLGLQ
jgi:hypothetical protein